MFTALTLTLLAAFLSLVALLYLAPATLYQWTIKLARRRAGLLRGEVTLSDGLRVAYLDGGQGEPLLLLHGFGANKDNFLAIAPFLRHRHRLIIPDIVGFGESSKPLSADYSPEAQVDRLRALVAALGVTGRVHVGGNSMGGLLAMYFGVRHPGRTASLWLLDPGGVLSGPITEIVRVGMEEKRNPFDIRTADDLADLFKKAFAKPPYIPGPFLQVQLREFIADRPVQDKVFDAIMKSDIEKRIAGLAVPTLIVWGEEDQIVHPAGAQILRGLLPNSNVILLPNVGHVPQIEVPRRAAADFLSFQAGLAEPAAPRAAAS